MNILRSSAILSVCLMMIFTLASCASKSQIVFPDNAPRIISDYESWTDTGGEKRKEKHNGIDIEGEIGDPIIAAADGTITKAEDSGKMGLRVVILHGKNEYGDYVNTVYLHNSKNLVEVGDKVKRGQKIAEMGQCPVCKTVHLHFAVWIVQPGVKKHHENPHKYWFDGPYQIACYDSAKEYPKGSMKFTYPVVCSK